MAQSWTIILWAQTPLPGRVLTAMADHLSPQRSAGLYTACLLCALERLSRVFDVERGHQLILALDDMSAALELSELHAEVGDWQWMDQGRRPAAGRLAEFWRALPPGPVLLVMGGFPAFDLSSIKAVRDAELEPNSLLAGPTSDGGLWLLGASQYPPAVFEAIDWQGEKVYDQLMMRGGFAGCRIEPLPVAAPLDRYRDVLRLERELAGSDEPALARLRARIRRQLGLE
ncbi:MAG: DUF2064 domain-containing protein [Phycisphaeraceae bacterium]|nr:DUF2064 domain-containing protein [Phycisphaeraceae bacterium]